MVTTTSLQPYGRSESPTERVLCHPALYQEENQKLVSFTLIVFIGPVFVLTMCQALF